MEVVYENADLSQWWRRLLLAGLRRYVYFAEAVIVSYITSYEYMKWRAKCGGGMALWAVSREAAKT